MPGAARCITTDARGIATYAVKPTDYVGLVPRLLVAEGDRVRRGDALMCDKQDERIRLTSPVTGRVKAIVRGEKRKLLAVVVEREGEEQGCHCDSTDVKEAMLQTGLWAMLRQRPFGIIANPDDKPKAVVVSAFDSAPLAQDYRYLLDKQKDDFIFGLKSLATLTDGILHVSSRYRQMMDLGALLSKEKNIAVHSVYGPHPAGNVGTQIAHLCPINKGDKVWTMKAQDVATLGHLMRTGKYVPEMVIAVAGSAAQNPRCYHVVAGACVADIVREQLPTDGSATRIISGNVLSGTQIEADGYLCAYDNLLTLLPEGDYYDFMGWLRPGVRKHSFSRTFLSGFLRGVSFLPKWLQPKFDTNLHGDVRPFVFAGDFERVFPFDIYPLQLIKACIVGDMELQEKLGIYEVEPEDFALCEYIDVSKTDIQPIIREALEKLRKEGA